jgi:ssDNA-binding Zn-finger/Zn-ribbon topoisomerase 1
MTTIAPTRDATQPGAAATMKGLSCPKCGGDMKLRSGSRGPFAGCKNFPGCTGSRSLPTGGHRATPPAATAAPRESASPAPETLSPADALIADLRKAGGHIGAALAILQRRAPEVDQLLAGETIENVVPF